MVSFCLTFVLMVLVLALRQTTEVHGWVPETSVPYLDLRTVSSDNSSGSFSAELPGQT